MIIVTGAAGFIGSAIIWGLNNRGYKDIIAVDELGVNEKWKNLINLSFTDYIEKADFLEELSQGHFKNVEAVIHMGACSSTQEFDASYLIKNNYEYTKSLASYCVSKNIRFIYASSAATYGDGALGYSDESIAGLKPLNMYGYSKHLFDIWAEKNKILNSITGLKFFNVFGPNEYHKEDMRSLVNKSFYKIKETGKMQLFKSYNPAYKDGQQKRDFLYIKDAVRMVLFLLDKPKACGIYNIGTGNASTWNDLANAIFKAMSLKPQIEYVNMPDVLKDKYQYFTQADMKKFMALGYKEKFFSLEEAVFDYVIGYLAKGQYL